MAILRFHYTGPLDSIAGYWTDSTSIAVSMMILLATIVVRSQRRIDCSVDTVKAAIDCPSATDSSVCCKVRLRLSQWPKIISPRLISFVQVHQLVVSISCDLLGSFKCIDENRIIIANTSKTICRHSPASWTQQPNQVFHG